MFQKNYDILYQLKNLSRIVLKEAPEKKSKTSWYSSTPKSKNCYDQVFRNLHLLPQCSSLKQWLTNWFAQFFVLSYNFKETLLLNCVKNGKIQLNYPFFPEQWNYNQCYQWWKKYTYTHGQAPVSVYCILQC